MTNIQTEELARLYFKTGQAAKAEQLANKNLQGNAFDRMPGIATVFDEYKRNGDALKFLQAAIARCKDAAILNRLEARLFDLLPEDAPAALQEKCFARLRSRRANSFKTKGERKEDEAYYNLLERLSEKFHREEQFTKELEDDWRNGSGSPAAGLRLLRIHEKNKRPDLLQKNSEMIFRHPDFTAQTMNAMRSPLEAAKCYDLLEKGYTLLCERDAMQNEPFINRARALVLLEREQDAWDVLERLGVRHIFSDEVAGMVAEEYVRQKNDIAAEKWFRIAMRQGPRQNPDVFFDYARLLIDRKDFVSARHVLLEVYRGSGTQEVEALARYFIESGRDASSDNEVSAFSLPPAAVNELRANLAEHFCEGGQAAKAVALTSAHPEILAVRPGLHSKIREAEGTDGASEKLPPDAKLPHASPAR